MPVIVKDDLKIAIWKNGYKHYGIYLFEKPNVWHKVATFNSDGNMSVFTDYLCRMFDIKEAENGRS